MLRVLIADDEERICQLIRALGEWQRLGLEVVGMAGNGPDALNMVRTLKPDILITDIRMPGCDGLQVVQEARSSVPDLEVIVISGYAQFDYAQTAIRYGVGEYLLKPINRDALNHALEKLVERCRTRQKSETDMASLKASHKDDQQLLRAKLVTDLLGGRFEAKTAEEVEHTYHFAAEADVWQLLLLKIDCDEHCSEASLAVVREKAMDVLEPIVSATCDEATVDIVDGGIFGVLNYPRTQQEQLRSQLRNGLNQLVAQKNIYGSVEFSLALSSLCDLPSALPQAMAVLANTAAERLIEGTGCLLEGEAGKSGLLEMDLHTRYSLAAAHAIDVMSTTEADAAVAILEEALEIPGVCGWELLALVRVAGMLFVTRLNAENSDALLMAFQERCGQCATTAALFASLRKLQQEQIVQAQQRMRDRDAQPIRNAKLYIRKHFASPITLEEVSSAIGFSVNYFSTLFKKETGEGFAKYLAHVRMDEARALLRETNLPVADICKNVGYGDIKHFTRSFKVETGITPGEYRKLYG